MPWLLNEDEALKRKLSGLTVTNKRSELVGPGPYSQAVPIWFRFPDPERVNQRSYPHISIDLIDVVFDPTRAARAWETILDYVPEGTPAPGVRQVLTQPDLPLPWQLMYQISTFTREPLQDRQLQFQLLALFPQQFGYLDMTEEDGTVRRADLVGVAQRDRVDEENKRLFQKVFTVSISSELSLAAAATVWQVLEKPSISMQVVDGVYVELPTFPLEATNGTPLQ